MIPIDCRVDQYHQVMGRILSPATRRRHIYSSCTLDTRDNACIKSINSVCTMKVTWCFCVSLVITSGLYVNSYCAEWPDSTATETGPLQYSPSMTGLRSHETAVLLCIVIFLTSFVLTFVLKFKT